MNTDNIIKYIAIPVGSVLLVGIALTSNDVLNGIGNIYNKVENYFDTEDIDMRSIFQQMREKEKEEIERNNRDSESEYKSASGSFSQGGKSKRSKSNTKKSKSKTKKR